MKHARIVLRSSVVWALVSVASIAAAAVYLPA